MTVFFFNICVGTSVWCVCLFLFTFSNTVDWVVFFSCVISETSVGEDSDEYFGVGEVQEGYNLRQTTRRRTASADDAMQQRLGASMAASPSRKRRRMPADVNPVLQPIGNYF